MTMISPIKGTAHTILNSLFQDAEKAFKGDCLYINGPIVGELVTISKRKLEKIVRKKKE